MRTAVLDSTEIVCLPVDRIATNPYQPRKYFERAPLEDLANSVREYGIMQPISVRLINGTSYELVAGERRLRASKMAGLEEIPAIVVNLTDQDSAILALIENLQRADLNYLEEAEGFNNLISDYCFTQEELARKIGKTQSTIANKLRLLRLSENVKRTLLENDLSERHARALLKLGGEQSQFAAVKKIIEDNMTVKRAEEYIDKILQNRERERKPKPGGRIRAYIKDMRLFTNTIRQAVDVMNSSGIDTVCDIEESADGCFMSIMVSY